MRVCFIGTCGHASAAYEVWRERTDVVFCGVAPWSEHENAASFAPDVPHFADAKEMLNAVRPDVAVVAPVFGLAAEAVLECAARGIDVLCEKPVATTLEQLARVERAVKESGIRLCAMHEMRFFPAFYKGAQLVKGGAIGEVCLINAQKSYKFSSHNPAWYAERALFGGTIPWVGIHAIDWIYHFTGKRFLSVRAQSDGACPERAALCQFTLEGDVPASLSMDYYRPKAAPTHGDDRIRVVGTRGVLEISGGVLRMLDENGEQTLALKPSRTLWERFAAGEEPIKREEIFYLTRVALLSREAADTGAEIKLEA